ncbi:MAG: hypothetical protein ABSH15_04335 [Verrucomicrobiota bacterium]|jgi:hypothetical protein
MTSRELVITKAVLNFLHGLDFHQATEPEIHAGISRDPAIGTPAPSVAELASVLKMCDSEKWITGAPARFNKRIMKWNINDAGEAALLEL